MKGGLDLADERTRFVLQTLIDVAHTDQKKTVNVPVEWMEEFQKLIQEQDEKLKTINIKHVETLYI